MDLIPVHWFLFSYLKLKDFCSITSTCKSFSVIRKSHFIQSPMIINGFIRSSTFIYNKAKIITLPQDFSHLPKQINQLIFDNIFNRSVRVGSLLPTLT